MICFKSVRPTLIVKINETDHVMIHFCYMIWNGSYFPKFGFENLCLNSRYQLCITSSTNSTFELMDLVKVPRKPGIRTTASPDFWQSDYLQPNRLQLIPYLLRLFEFFPGLKSYKTPNRNRKSSRFARLKLN